MVNNTKIKQCQRNSTGYKKMTVVGVSRHPPGSRCLRSTESVFMWESESLMYTCVVNKCFGWSSTKALALYPGHTDIVCSTDFYYVVMEGRTESWWRRWYFTKTTSTVCHCYLWYSPPLCISPINCPPALCSSKLSASMTAIMPCWPLSGDIVQ